jgi:hypothetical protein
MTSDLTSEERRKLSTALRDDPALCERVLASITDHNITVRLATAVSAQGALSEIAKKANEILERFAAVEERRAAWWEQVSGPKGAIALAIGSATTIATAWITAGGLPHP